MKLVLQFKIADEDEELNIANEGSEHEVMDEGSYVTYQNSAHEAMERESLYSYHNVHDLEEMESLFGDQTSADEVIEEEQFELRAEPEGTDDQ